MPSNRRVLQQDLETKETIQRFASATEASQLTGVSVSGISNVCNRKSPEAKGYYWSYEERKTTPDIPKEKLGRYKLSEKKPKQSDLDEIQFRIRKYFFGLEGQITRNHSERIVGKILKNNNLRLKDFLVSIAEDVRYDILAKIQEHKRSIK